MSQIANSASRAGTQLFGVITVTADSISHAVKSVGNAFEVANIHSNEWLQTTRLKASLLSVDREEKAIDEVAFAMSDRMIQREKILDANAGLRVAYDLSCKKLREVLEQSKAMATA